MPTLADNSSVKNICVDDFALRKLFSYGTFMVDLDSHRIIDLTPTRNTEEVKIWLAEYPNIEVISRDGVQIYASAAKKSHPKVIQVSDRFHIIKGLTDAITRYLIRELPARIEIPEVSVNTDEIRRLQNINNRSERVAFVHQKHKEGLTVNEITLLLHSTTKTVQKYLKLEPSEIVDRIIVKEKNHLLALQQKQQEVDNARELAKKGIPIEQIAKEMRHTYKTIQNYLSPEYSIEDRHYSMRIPGKLSPYESEVIKLRSEYNQQNAV